jgi:hypothetical protein
LRFIHNHNFQATPEGTLLIIYHSPNRIIVGRSHLRASIDNVVDTPGHVFNKTWMILQRIAVDIASFNAFSTQIVNL